VKDSSLDQKFGIATPSHPKQLSAFPATTIYTELQPIDKIRYPFVRCLQHLIAKYPQPQGKFYIQISFTHYIKTASALTSTISIYRSTSKKAIDCVVTKKLAQPKKKIFWGRKRGLAKRLVLQLVPCWYCGPVFFSVRST
jgi:hypothetical protein